ncbi:hypothetical protein BX600DRAFT_312268 [Xylariales sp. PMI_506]|nr:hypothetical protein BX600DRAFT_312268 [Xylariales sp. PMI_506]
MGSYDADPDSAVQLFRLSHGLAQPDTDLCDERLNSLKVQFWTTVPVSSTFAAKILSLYLKTDHPLLGTFDADLFVHDLVNQQQRYCSSFLVNCVLYWGCQMYSAIDKTANDYAYRFCDEAERLWEVEKRSDSILNMAGIQMLSLAYIGHGKDHYVLQYLSAAVQMGKRLGLLGVDRSTATRELSKIPEGLHQAHAFAAWGIFNWTVLMSIFYQQPGLEYPKFPPMLPIPGASDAENSYTPSAGAIFQLRNELPQYMGNTFTALCGFWRIMHEVSLEYYSNGQDLISDRIKIEFAEMKYREILAWAETLPQSLARRPNCPHHVLTFHMWLHSAILDIFRPFIKLDDYKQLRLRTFSAVACSPDMAYRASVKQLKHLIVQYRSNYESSLYTILWHTALTYVANAVIVDPEDTQWRLYFLLCLYGYEALRRPFRISEAIGRGLLTMSLRYRDVNSEDARRILEQLKDRGLNHVKGDIRATFMGDLGLAMTNPMEAKVESLANDFDDMALFREFTHSSEEVNHPIAN